jgi:hypothetical protein
MKRSIGPDTRLKKALELDPRVVDYIVSLNPHDFERLRNPLMRRLMAPRITLGRVAAMARVPVAELLERIAALSNVPVEFGEENLPTPQSPEETPLWVTNMDPAGVRVVDLLPLDDASDTDPMPAVAKGVKSLALGEALLIKHRWEPQPLYDVWDKTGGLEWFAQQVSDDEWWVWVHRNTDDPRLARQ